LSLYLLDTNILSDLIRDETGPAGQALGVVGPESVCTSVVVAGELRFGAARRGSPRLSADVEKLLGLLPVLPLEAPADRLYAEVRNHLQSRGQPIGANDLLIAVQALAAGCILVTDNVREFERVPGLKVENWLR
jgi:tRNA(fMet)-specific endonuclease VapC